MKRKFVVTQNVKRFVDLMDTLKNAPANLPKMALVYGDFGLGKSQTIMWWVTNNDGLVILAEVFTNAFAVPRVFVLEKLLIPVPTVISAPLKLSLKLNFLIWPVTSFISAPSNSIDAPFRQLLPQVSTLVQSNTLKYPLLYSVIGKQFNTGSEQATEFRIPDYNISGRFLQPSSSPATKKEAGLPNITGVVGAIGATGATHTGAFYNYGKGGVLSNSGEADYNAGFNASRCSTIYGNSTTVQPPSQGVHVCIRYK